MTERETETETKNEISKKEKELGLLILNTSKDMILESNQLFMELTTPELTESGLGIKVTIEVTEKEETNVNIATKN